MKNLQNGDYIDRMNKYKAKVKKFLMDKNNYTEESADELMGLYEDDFKEFLDNGWSPGCAATAMRMGY
ncbi:MAG: hypothetical protein IJK66_06275 [Bacilli bacterium]|nr:hypothetical protein [Bacilli bacterium]